MNTESCVKIWFKYKKPAYRDKVLHSCYVDTKSHNVPQPLTTAVGEWGMLCHNCDKNHYKWKKFCSFVFIKDRNGSLSWRHRVRLAWIQLSFFQNCTLFPYGRRTLKSGQHKKNDIREDKRPKIVHFLWNILWGLCAFNWLSCRQKWFYAMFIHNTKTKSCVHVWKQ